MARGKTNRKRPPRRRPIRLTITAILIWADAYHARHGKWPNRFSGEVRECRWTTWRQVERALQDGFRGLRGGSSIAKLLARRRQRRNQGNLAKLTKCVILQWADAHYRRTGRWPTTLSGPVQGVPGETWRRIDGALRRGSRGLKSDTLAELLERHRGYRNKRNLPRLTLAQIRRWARIYRIRHGCWPTKVSGPIESTGESWVYVDEAMRKGFRGLPGGSSLFRLLRNRECR